MADILLTTLAHAKERIDFSSTATSGANRDLMRMIGAISQEIKQFCQADLGVGQYIEQHQLDVNARAIYPDNPLIRSVQSLTYDPLGLFAGGETQLFEGSDFEIDPEGRRLNLMIAWPNLFRDPNRVIRLAYTGGQAYQTLNTVYSVTPTGTFVAGTYALTDGRSIILTSYDSVGKLLTFQPDIGNFYQNDVIPFGTSATAVLGVASQPSICNDIPLLEDACLMQVAYEWERRKSAGRNSTQMGSGETHYAGEYKLLDSVKDRIRNYRVSHVRS
jgi:hypothetical protein